MISSGTSKTTSTSETSNKLQLLKRWEVLDVDARGVATLQLKLLALKMETTTPGGDVLVFDSTNLANSTEGLREKLNWYVGPVLAVLCVDGRGRVVEVKESNFGPASKYDNELPFAGVLPENMPRPDQSWDRPYKVTLAPPQGTGEQFAAVQKYRLKNSTPETLTMSLTTESRRNRPSWPTAFRCCNCCRKEYGSSITSAADWSAPR